jgi:hypothetical protein
LAQELGAQYIVRFEAGASADYFCLSDELHNTARPDFREIADKSLRAAAKKRANAEHGPNSGEEKRIIQHNCPAQYFDKKLTSGDDYKRRRREGLTREILLEKWEAQGGLCAITKLPMMLDAREGSNPYNCSIDQERPRSKGGTYEPKNVRLVLDGVNRMRSNFEDADIAAICRAILETLG